MIFYVFSPSPVYADTCEFRTYTGITYANGMFVSAGGCVGGQSSTSVIITTPDGYTPFTERYNHDRLGSGILNAITYAGGIFVAVGSCEVVTSSDGVVWTGQYDITVTPNDIVYAEELFVCPCDAGQVILTSPNAGAGTWTVRALGDDRIRSMDGVAYGNGKFVAVGKMYDDFISQYRPISATSEDGISWTTHFQSDIVGQFCSVAFSGLRFVAVAAQSWDNNVYTSLDGVTWTGYHIGPVEDAFFPKRIRKTWAGLVAVGSANTGGSAAYVSLNGVNWTAMPGVGYSALRDVTGGPDYLVGSRYLSITPFYPSYVTVSENEAAFDHKGGSGSVDVTVAPLYSYDAESTADWVHLTSGTSYEGNATVSFTVDANTGAEDRSGGILIEKRYFEVQQSSRSGSIAPLFINLLFDE